MNFDGEIHACSEEYAYIVKKIDAEKNISDLHTLTLQYIEKYCNYLMLYEPEKVLKILVEKFNPYTYSSFEDFQFIYKPAYLIGTLSRYSTFAMKFKRSSRDELEVDNDE